MATEFPSLVDWIDEYSLENLHGDHIARCDQDKFINFSAYVNRRYADAKTDWKIRMEVPEIAQIPYIGGQGTGSIR